MKKICWLIVFCLLGQATIAQPFGGTPASFKWKELQTDTVRIVFPATMEAEARRIAGLLHALQ
ncbi:MAG: hypothetical protein ACK56A_02105, partial [Bacteroidota bacterium]